MLSDCHGKAQRFGSEALRVLYGGNKSVVEQYKKKALVGQTKSSVTFLLGDFFEEIEIFPRKIQLSRFFSGAFGVPQVQFLPWLQS